MALTEEQRAKLNAKFQQKQQVNDAEYQEFLRYKAAQQQQQGPNQPNYGQNFVDSQYGNMNNAHGVLRKKTPLYKRPWFIVLCVIFIYGWIRGTVMMSNSRSNSGTQANKSVTQSVQKSSTQGPSADDFHAYTFDQLINELHENALRAETNHQDEYVFIEGYLDVIDSDGKYYSVNGGSESTHWLDDISCSISSNETLESVMNMNKGDRVMVAGRITSIGEVLGYRVDTWYVGALPDDMAFEEAVARVRENLR